MKDLTDPAALICLVALVIWMAAEFAPWRRFRLTVAIMACILASYVIFGTAAARGGEHMHRQRTNQLILDALQHGQSDQVITALQRYLDLIASGEPEIRSQWTLWEALVAMKTNTMDRGPKKEP